jgi:hypothetical protein
MKKSKAIIDKVRKGEALSPIDDDRPLKGPWQNHRALSPAG